MFKSFQIILASALVLLGSVAVFAQNPVTVSVSVAPSTVAKGGKGTAKLTANIAAPWYIYSITQGPGGPFAARVSLDAGVFTAGGISGSKSKIKFDENFKMNTETHSGSAVFTIPFTVSADAPDGPQTLTASLRFQACNGNLCLPPRTIKASATVNIGALAATTTSSPTPSPSALPSPTPTPSPTATPAADQTNSNTAVPAVAETPVATPADSQPRTQIAQSTKTAGGDLEGDGFWGFIWLAMSFGALSLLTPCVFPMIPITVSYFTKNAAESHLGSVRDALLYAGGIILTFTALGIALALLFGAAGINQFAANPWINLLIMGIFLTFAFSLLGAYNIGIPPSILNRLDKLTRSKEGSKTLGLLLMGLTFSLTSFTCTAPLVGTILVAAANGKLFYPIVGMLAFSSVFALPFFVLAIAPRLLHSLPSSGGWMNALKVVMGFLEIGAALKFLSNADLVWGWGIFTREVVIAGWTGLSVLIVLYLLGVFKLVHDYGEVKIGLVRVLNAFLFMTLAFYLLTGLFGAKLGEIESFLPPMKESLTGSTNGSDGELGWIVNDLGKAQTAAREQNKPILIDFTGYTCTNCRWMEVNMFPKPSVRGEMEKYVRVRLYTDGEGEPYEGFQKMQEARFGTVALPLYAIVSPNDEIITRFEGLTRNEEEFAGFLKSGLTAGK